VLTRDTIVESKQLYINETNDVTTSIVDDKTNRELIYCEIRAETLYLEFNGVPYLVESASDGHEMYMVSQEGDKLVIFLEEEDLTTDSPNDDTVSAPLKASKKLKDTVYSLSNDKSYTKDVGPVKTTNKSLISIISDLGTVAGIASLVIKHPILSTVSVVFSTSASIADKSIVTFYIRYWRSYEKNQTNPKTRCKERWFSESDCANQYYIKNRTHYFYGRKPL